MGLNEVTSMRELELHGVINGLMRDLNVAKEENACLKLKMDAIVERAEIAERELLDREESIYKLTLKLISCEARLLAALGVQDLELREKADWQEREIEALRLSSANKDMRIKALEVEFWLREKEKLKMAVA